MMDEKDNELHLSPIIRDPGSDYIGPIKHLKMYFYFQDGKRRICLEELIDHMEAILKIEIGERIS